MISSLLTAIQVPFVITCNDIYSYFYSWVAVLFWVTTMVMLFMIKPQRKDLTYKTVLCTQYFIFSMVSQLLGKIRIKWQMELFVNFKLNCLLWFALFNSMLWIRFNIAKIFEADLYNYLTSSVLRFV